MIRFFVYHLLNNSKETSIRQLFDKIRHVAICLQKFKHCKKHNYTTSLKNQQNSNFLQAYIFMTY